MFVTQHCSPSRTGVPGHREWSRSVSTCLSDWSLVFDRAPHLDATATASVRGYRSIGPHACPARSPAYVVVEAAIDLLLDALPEMDLAVPAEHLTWRPDPFHRALAVLPVTFPPAPPLNPV